MIHSVFSNWSWCLVYYWKRLCWSRFSLHCWYIDFCYHWWDWFFWIWKNLNTVLDIIFVWASFATGKNDAKELDRMGMFNFSAAAVIIHIMVKPIQENLSNDPNSRLGNLNGFLVYWARDPWMYHRLCHCGFVGFLLPFWYNGKDYHYSPDL